MEESKTFYIYNRNEWKNLKDRDFNLFITGGQVDKALSVNDKLTVQDANEIYLPIIQILNIFQEQYLERQYKVNYYLGKAQRKPTFVIGVSGSVAVGKSTIARLLKDLLQQAHPEQKIELITTDGFLYPNAVLEEMGLSDYKGFPESYNMMALINFLSSIKNGTEEVKVARYSHEVNDIVAGEYDVIEKPNILIVEGINTLQLPASEHIFASEFFDYSFYIDAEPHNIEKWYMQRYFHYLKEAKGDPEAVFYELSEQSLDDAYAYGKYVWETVNLKNLYENILPTRYRADMIIHKGDEHVIDSILLRKY